MTAESLPESAARVWATAQPPLPCTAPAIRVRLLGGFELRLDDSPVSLPSSSQRVVALLALRGRCGRSRLAGSLWPEAVEERAMACLRTAIWRANSAAPGMVRGDRGVAALTEEADVDVRQILVSSGALLGANPPAILHESLWDTGSDVLLPEWDDEWLVEDRERLRQLQLHVIEAQGERLLAGGSFGLAMEWALAAARMDPLRESAHRLVIRIHLAEGNLAEARRAFARCTELFLRELGISPTSATAALLPHNVGHTHAQGDRLGS